MRGSDLILQQPRVTRTAGRYWPSAALAAPQRPSESDADAILERGRTAALQYSRSLPDFVCTEVIQRYHDPTGERNPLSGTGVARRIAGLVPRDTLTVKLSYFEQKEQHKLTLIDEKRTDKTYESLGGAIGAGEFGGMLHGIFDPSSAASFRWESWKTVRGRRTAVYSYAVEQPGERVAA